MLGGSKMESKTVLKVQDLCKNYSGKEILKNISFEVNEGDVFGFLGPNGSGKTTTIRSVLGLIKKNSGQVIINNYDMDKDFIKGIKEVGAVVETPRFHEYLSGYDNLKLIANLHKELSKSDIEKVLKDVGMWKKSKAKVKTYSLGMKQRLGIAMALLNNPRLVILDEPTNGLDPQGIKEIRDLIIDLAKNKNITFFISTHLLAEVEQICNKVVIIENGKTLIEGNMDNLLNQDRDKVELICMNTGLAEQIIEKTEYARVESVNNESMMISIEKNRQEELNRQLYDRGICIKYVIPRNQSLEDYFISVTKGGEQHV